MTNMMQLAHHIIGVANEQKIGVTNLHLQLTMFYALGNAISDSLLTDEEFKQLYDEPFSPYAYGVRVDSVYEAFKKYNSSNITMNAQKSKAFEFLDERIIELLLVRTSSLVKHVIYCNNRLANE